MEGTKVYEVYQWHLTDAEHNAINANGWEAAPKNYCDTRFGDASPEAFAESFQSYTNVANIRAKDLNEVFDIGNGYGEGPAAMPEDRISRFSKMHSVSVGDLIRDTVTGECYAVAGYGFTELGKELA